MIVRIKVEAVPMSKVAGGSLDGRTLTAIICSDDGTELWTVPVPATVYEPGDGLDLRLPGMDPFKLIQRS